MTTRATISVLTPAVHDDEAAHHRRLALAWILAAILVAALAVYGFDYYSLGAAARPLSPKHSLLRPSGAIGIKLGMFGTAMFFGIYFYYFRKRWGWLRSFGTTKQWLDFHIVLGVTAPIVIAFHSAFKFRGIAGMAFWIMLAVALSGIVGRYLYSQIPRHMNAAELSWQELKDEQARLTHELAMQQLFNQYQLAPLFRMPSVDRVKRESAVGAILWMMKLDLARPLRVAALRRRILGFMGVISSLGGILSSGNRELESVVRIAKEQAALTKRIVFLERSQRVFQLWHVVHRPFSYAFVVLALLHIATAMLLGYL